MPRSPSRRRAMLVLPLCAIVTACAIGPRPTLTEPQPVDDGAAATVLERLERTPVGDFTAVYEITPSSGVATTVATVSRHGTELRAQIGDIVYTSNGTATTTCDADGGACDDYANETRISDLGVTHQFWGSAFRRRLANDSGRRIGTSTGTVATIAGQSAACVAITVPSSLEAAGTVSYCALDHGLLGRYVGADGTIELTAFTLA